MSPLQADIRLQFQSGIDTGTHSSGHNINIVQRPVHQYIKNKLSELGVSEILF